MSGPRIEGWVDRLGGLLERHRRLAIALGDLESRVVSEKIAAIPIRAPVYVCGLARSGSTILLELLARHRELATHRYRDFPPVLAPVLWNGFVDRAAARPAAPAERAHRDGIVVTPESPEAFEEVVWMAFFPHLHDPAADAVLDCATSNPAFEAFYRDHLRKLLLVRGGRRYLAKANYDVTRLAYIQKLFPDARFVVPVREPSAHVASLMKQHALFCRDGRADPRVTRHMSRAGHFEFGLDRRPVGIGGCVETARVARLWERGDEVEGWARYWSLVYRHVLDRIDANPALRAATLVVRFEDLCADPAAVMGSVLDHCLLSDKGIVERARETVRAPDYYAPGFTAGERALIGDVTGDVAARLGYPRSRALRRELESAAR